VEEPLGAAGAVLTGLAAAVLPERLADSQATNASTVGTTSSRDGESFMVCFLRASGADRGMVDSTLHCNGASPQGDRRWRCCTLWNNLRHDASYADSGGIGDGVALEQVPIPGYSSAEVT
jgi:hypothetical protein